MEAIEKEREREAGERKQEAIKVSKSDRDNNKHTCRMCPHKSRQEKCKLCRKEKKQKKKKKKKKMTVDPKDLFDLKRHKLKFGLRDECHGK
jgi:recombinational DNA repair protein RecR